MKKIFIVCLYILSFSCNAVESNWHIYNVIGYDANIAGYIYHTSAIGTQTGTKPNKAITSLRLICSTKEFYSTRTDDPIIALTWEKMTDRGTKSLSIDIDGKNIIMSPIAWNSDNNILFRKLSHSTDLIQSMKTGRFITFSWSDNSIERKTTFGLKSFNSKLNEFFNKCSSDL